MPNGTPGDDTLELTNSPANVSGFGGNDSITTSLAGTPALTSFQHGGGGDDTLTSALRAQPDSNDVVMVSANNRVVGGAGVDVITANATASYRAADFGVSANPTQLSAQNIISDTGAASTISARADAQRYRPTEGSFSATNDVTTGGGADTIDLSANGATYVANRVYSGAGADYIRAIAYGGGSYSTLPAQAVVVMDTGFGNDEVWSRAEISNRVLDPGANISSTDISGGSGNDSIRASADFRGRGGGTAEIDLSGGNGNDELFATGNGYRGTSIFNLKVDGGAGSDWVNGTIRSNAATTADILLLGQGGNDRISANTDLSSSYTELHSTQKLYGGAGADTVSSATDLSGYKGETATALLWGGFGSDDLSANLRLRGEDAGSTALLSLGGGAGNDSLAASTLIYGGYRDPASTSLPAVQHILTGGSGRDQLRSEFAYSGAIGDHNLSGGAGADRIAAIAGAEATIDGGTGNDTILSSASAATIDAGAGTDVIAIDSPGNATLTLGTGSDRVVINTDLQGQGTIRITDWNQRFDQLILDSYRNGRGESDAVDLFNDQITSYGTIGTDSYLTFSSGLRLEFADFIPTGALSDISSFVRDDSQISLTPGGYSSYYW